MDTLLANPIETVSLTRTLAQQTSAVTYDALPESVRALARQCVLDYYGVALAGADDPLAKILLDELAEAGGAAQASIIGHQAKLPALSAALVNGGFVRSTSNPGQLHKRAPLQGRLHPPTGGRHRDGGMLALR